MGKHFRIAVIFSLLLAPLFGLAAPSPAPVAAQAAKGTVVAHAIDKHGKPLPGACYVTAFGARGGFPDGDPVCDSADGADDGTATLDTQATGTTNQTSIVMVRAPKGYLVGGLQTYSVDAGASTEVTFKPQKGGQALDLTLLDGAGKAITGVCLNVYVIDHLGNYPSIAASDCADRKSKGRFQIEGLTPGHFAVYPTSTPKNTASSDGTLYALIGKENGAKLTFHFEPAGTAKITVLGSDGAPITQGVCFSLTKTKTARPYFDFLCPSAAGEFVTNNLRVGTYVVTNQGGGMPAGMQFPDKTIAFTIKAGSQSSATIQLEQGGQAVVVTVLDPNGNVRPRACAQILTAVGSGFGVSAGYACGNGTPLWGVKPGDYVARVYFSPVPELAPGPGVPFTVVAGQEADVTAQLIPSATLVVSARDKKRKNIVGACFAATASDDPTAPYYGSQKCDSDDGVADGIVTFTGIPAGTPITVNALTLPDGWGLPVAQTVSADPGATVTVKFAAKPGGSTFRIRRLGDGRDSLFDACYKIYTSKHGKLGDYVTSRCDYQDENGSDGLTVIPNMPAGDFIAVEFSTPVGAKKTKDAPFTMVASEDNEIMLSNP